MKKMHSEYYHYKDSGLSNIFLKNGFEIRKTSYGDAVSIIDVEGLHFQIAVQLVQTKPHLTGPEFRFIRKELGLSQSKLAHIFGNNEQSIALWEKHGRVPKWADRLIRHVYSETKLGKNEKYIELVEKLNALDREEIEQKLYFNANDGWRVAA